MTEAKPGRRVEGGDRGKAEQLEHGGPRQRACGKGHGTGEGTGKARFRV